MNEIVIYYSLLGHNKEIAENISREKNCDLIEFAPGNLLRCFQFFLRHKKLKKQAKKLNISKYNDIIICGPIWAGKPAAAIKILMETLDLNNKSIKTYFTFTQDYGETEKFVQNLMEKKGANLLEIQFKNISKKVNEKEI
ncbi:MAG: flavodoxin family protein [Promethearchaeota archaeon]